MPESKFKLRAAVILFSVNMLFMNANWLAELALSYSIESQHESVVPQNKYHTNLKHD